jgi:hypothetical protein
MRKGNTLLFEKISHKPRDQRIQQFTMTFQSAGVRDWAE